MQWPLRTVIIVSLTARFSSYSSPYFIALLSALAGKSFSALLDYYRITPHFRFNLLHWYQARSLLLMYYLFPALCFTISHVWAMPVLNETWAEEPGPEYVAEPRGRGTTRIISGCVITLTLCVWTAIHLNIVPRPTTARIMWYKITFVLLGIFAPEVVLATAFEEWRAASRILLAAQLSESVADGYEAAKNAERILACVSDTFGGTEHLPPRLAAAHQQLATAVTTTRNAADAAWRSSLVAFAEYRRAGKLIATEHAQLHKEDAYSETFDPAAKKLRDRRLRSTDPYNMSAWRKAKYEFQSAGVQSNTESRQRTARAQAKKTKKATVLLLQMAREFCTGEPPIKRLLQEAMAHGIPTADTQPPVTGYQKWRKSALHPNKTKEYGFGMEGAFYAVMGGYTFLRPHTPHESPEQLTLAAHGLPSLLRNGVITRAGLATLKGDVVDKGKTDTLAKFLVCCQAFWMVVNILARAVAGLHITLLEINVALHVLCAILTYAFWWRKPHNAKRTLLLPDSILDSRSRALIYLMQYPQWQLYGSGVLQNPASSETWESHNNSVLNPVHETIQSRVSHDTLRVTVIADEKEVRFTPGTPEPEVTNSHPDIILRQDGLISFRNCTLACATSQDLRTDIPVDLQEADSTQLWNNEQLNEFIANQTPDRGQLWISKTFTWSSEISPLHALRRSLESPIIAVCAVYGGVHASVWNGHFPTSAERALWRASCIILALPGLAIGVGSIWSYGLARLESVTAVRWMKRILSPILAILPMLNPFSHLAAAWGDQRHRWIVVPCLAVFFAARAYLVIEAFISLRSLPNGAFETVNWANFWPHL